MRPVALFATLVIAALAQPPGFPGKLQKMPWGGRLHLHCMGTGTPAIIIETGFQDFSFTWKGVQQKLSSATRVCAYDRAGYAWSDPGPEPRTLAQLNLELRELLRRRNVKPPYVLVGHSFGGNVVRSYAEIYPGDVAGVMLVDAVHPEQQISMGGGKTARLFELAKGRPIPAPHWKPGALIRPKSPSPAGNKEPLPSPFQTLPPTVQELYRTFAGSPLLSIVEQSQGSWSEESMAIWKAKPQQLGAVPLLVLSRGRANDSDRESERLRLQESLATGSARGTWHTLACGHNMHLECPDALTGEILHWEPFSKQGRR